MDKLVADFVCLVCLNSNVQCMHKCLGFAVQKDADKTGDSEPKQQSWGNKLLKTRMLKSSLKLREEKLFSSASDDVHNIHKNVT